MVDRISVAIALEGGKEVQQQLADIGEAGQKAFDDISKSAEQVGGFKNLKPEEVTAKLKDLGVEGADAIDKIQGAVKSAGRWETVVQAISAVETGLATLASAAVVVGGAVIAATTALSKFTSQAAAVAEQLRPLAALSGESSASVSAMQIAFAQGGTSAEKFAKEFTNLEIKVQEASGTMADDVEQSSMRIAEAHQKQAEASLGVTGATLSLQAARLRLAQVENGEVDPAARRALAISQARLAVQEAQQKQAQAELAQKKAEHDARVAEANDLQMNIDLYKQMATGADVAFNALTTQATQNRALFATLAQAGNNYKFVLADILKNASELDRIQIAKALGLDPKTVDTLKQGSAALKEQQAAVEALGIALTDADQKRLKAFSDSWAKLGATAVAALQKLGAALAGTTIPDALQVALEAVIHEVENFVSDIQKIGQEFNRMAELGATAIGYVAEGVKIAGAAIVDFGAAVADIVWTPIQAGIDLWNQVTKAINDALAALQQFFGAQSEGGTPLPGGAPIGGAGGGIGSQAAGGLIGGYGSGTSDSNLAWVSRGEYVVPARAVAQPGMLAFLEALRRTGGSLTAALDGMSRFALGGMVPRSIPAFAGGGLVGGMNNVTINFPGLPPVVGLRASAAVVDDLRRSAALAQVRSGGRKPSRYS